MKKKIIIVGIIIAMASVCMTGCKKKAECFYCGEEKRCNEKILDQDEKVYMCEECEKEYKEILFK